MITLNEIAYNIKNLAYGGKNTLENNISITQIKHWIHYHRARIITDNISKGILNSSNIYSNFVLGDFWPIPYTHDYNYHGLNAYGISSAKKQNRGDWRNQGYIDIDTPGILTLPNDGAIKDVAVRRRVRDMPNAVYSDAGPEIPVYRKSLSERQFGDFNKFTSNDKPYYMVERMREGHSSVSGETYIRIHGLKNSPLNQGDLHTPGAEEIAYTYRPMYRAILQNPSEKHSKLPYFKDDKTPYPIPMEYVSDLIQRVIQVEMQTELKTNADEVVDGLDDNLRLKSSGTQVQR